MALKDEDMKIISDMHKAGLVTDHDMADYVKQYAEAMLAPAIAINPAQKIDGNFPKMHAHTLINPLNPAHGHASNAPGGLSSVVGQAKARVVEDYMPDKDTLWRTFAGRMRLPHGSSMPLDFIEFHVAKDKVYVFCVTESGATIIEDDRGLFPSDALITAIKLLKG